MRPEQMSKVSIVGSKQILSDTIEKLHDLNLIHIDEYGGDWEGFEKGNPIEGSDEVSEKLVQIRSIEDILDVKKEDFESPEQVDEEKLEEIREEVNELEDESRDIREELREIQERKEELKPFADLGIDLDLLKDYRTIEIVVGQGDSENIRSNLEKNENIKDFEIIGNSILAIIAKGGLDDALSKTDFSRIEVPDEEGDPEEIVERLENKENELNNKLENIREEKEELAKKVADLLFSAEEEFKIKAEKKEVPIHFATTEYSFIAEGWIPTKNLEKLENELRNSIDGGIDIEEIDRVKYTENDAPVKQDNPSVSSPFELLVRAINIPKYSEIDPTLAIFLTFPALFGFMIGDVGYGLLYIAIGYLIYNKLKGAAWKSLGGVAMWAGIFTVIFGFLYGELFGSHIISSILWGGSAPIHKGLSSDWALVWLIVALVVALIHLNIGYIFGFINEVSHGIKEALLENISWLLLMDGIWIWIFSKHVANGKPTFLIGSESVFNSSPVALGFTGIPESIGVIGLGIGLIGFIGVLAGEVIAQGGKIGALIGGFESLNALVNVLSYTRITAVLLAKAGMAFVVNLMVFGAYTHGEELHLLIGKTCSEVSGCHLENVLFPGLSQMGIGGIVGGILVLIVGHLLVLALGITSAGLQAVRLEYVEFFSKFYKGGGEEYSPFGHEKEFTE